MLRIIDCLNEDDEHARFAGRVEEARQGADHLLNSADIGPDPIEEASVGHESFWTSITSTAAFPGATFWSRVTRSSSDGAITDTLGSGLRRFCTRPKHRNRYQVCGGMNSDPLGTKSFVYSWSAASRRD